MPIIDDEFIRDLRQKISDHETTSATETSDDTAEQAFKKLVRLVSVRERSTEEMRKRLRQEDFDEIALEQALERAHRCGLLDDIRFAESLIRTRLSGGRGIKGIEAELARNDISLFDLEGLCEEVIPSEEEEFARAYALLRQKPPRSKNKRDGAYRKLVSKGFSSSVAAEAATRWAREDH